MSNDIALLTKTYRRDLAAFTDLCSSIDRLMPDVTHYVLVDSGDRVIFARFASDRRIILDCAELLPAFRELNLFGRRVWWHAPFHVVRGWIYQQLAKVQAVAGLNEQAVVLVDSDVEFIRQLDAGGVIREGKVALYHQPGAPSGPEDQSPKWHDIASEALGLPKRGYTGSDYISTVIAWSPEVVRAMLQEIERVHHRPWYNVLLRHFRFSECVLYGIFCDHVSGAHQEKVAHTQGALCHWSWSYDLSQPAGRARYVEDFGSDKVAALIQSNLGLPDAIRKGIIAQVRAKVAADD
ncbi:DUF6492 family protein [Aurantiacibacter sp. D1-12]|uniref:DUF6492 family protein n=1 Tax=Aurantiacibacter sp. D1-12 TaxID=2993658 RepID=UPI00237C5C46|nr:DUF6492 family protein [Aurantiacibacter sp. D1-12]MDE1467461.1 DUF6492 family protein [Aurantiacibacter sp. D1-12]